MAWGESGEFDKVANANANGGAKERGQYLNQFRRFFMASPMLLKKESRGASRHARGRGESG